MSRTSQQIQSSLPREGVPLSSLQAPPYRSVGTTVLVEQYLWVHVPEHPNRNRWNHIPEHRHVAEHFLGRFLVRGEVVHHEDRNKQNNAPENLRAFPDQAAHMCWHKKQESHCHNPRLIELVRPMAADKLISQREAAIALGIDVQTVMSLCRRNDIEWVSAAETHLTEQSVREALQGRGVMEAAAHLGVSYQTLSTRFPHITQRRARPGSLESQKEEIHSLATRVRADALAMRYGVSLSTMLEAIRKWRKLEPDAWSDVAAFQRSKTGIRWSHGRKASAQSSRSP